MDAPAYYCPACGGPQRHAGRGNCDYCGAVRVPLGVPDPRSSAPCPHCLTLVDGHHGFCPSCGHAQGETPPPSAQGEFACPACADQMSIWALDPRMTEAGYRGSEAQIHGCRGCGGAWVDRRTLDEMIAWAKAHANLRPDDVKRQTMAISEVVHYRPCPSCRQRMNRRNFARYSGIVVDECRSCGTFFDAGELEGVVAFVRTGGLALVERREAEAKRAERGHLPMLSSRTDAELPSTEFDLVIPFLRWVGQWVRRIAR
ncbi:zf-TFIIB domain-containing protein [Enhygromyxa salina]|uniref:Double zinc ribbon n=1 Tax=Enhygromyxa salina TaxID=215803 RepID=A0A2S9YMR5_9BACT|nr:zf-TFIIB domain-containing protein [Enhygromyxa salina]PRQ06378.1 Double zinc ribbon [Enhygromyxa salina]